MKLLGRDPQWWGALTAAIIMGVSTFVVPLSDDQQAVLNGVVFAILAIVVAVVARSGVSLALAVNLTKAVIALMLGFGLHLSPEAQAALMTLVTAVGSGFLRTQLTAPVGPDGKPVPVAGSPSSV